MISLLLLFDKYLESTFTLRECTDPERLCLLYDTYQDGHFDIIFVSICPFKHNTSERA